MRCSRSRWGSAGEAGPESVRTLCGVAPEIRPETIDAKGNLRDDLDLDSVDFMNFVVALHVALEHEFGIELGGHLADTLFEAFVLVSEGELGAFAMHGLCNAVGNRAVAEQSGNQNAFSCEKAHFG